MPDTRPNVSSWGERWDKYVYLAFAALMFGFSAGAASQRQWLDMVNFSGFATIWFSYAYLRRRWIIFGWQRGREAARLAAVEAERRGLTLTEWITSEYERAL